MVLVIDDQRKKLKGFTPSKESELYATPKLPTASQSVIIQKDLLLEEQNRKGVDLFGEEQKTPDKEVVGFDRKVFKYNTASEELVEKIEENLKRYKHKSDVSALDETGRKHYETAMKLHELFDEFINDKRWEYCDKGEIDDNGNEWTGYNMVYEGYICSKSVGTIPATPIELYTYTNDSKYTSDFSGLVKNAAVIQQYPVNMSLVRMRGEGSMFMSAREFLVAKHCAMNADGSIEVVSGSTEDARCPLDKDFIRADMKISGTRYTPVQGGTEVVTISIADPKGSIPSFFKNSAAKQQTSKVNLIAKAYKKRFE
eukprot:TRINITY_DN6570_c0_g2_i3.p1 TRINITY_DN6570_c0_g2~~TRINITY_DN6570_c0_g2_i3.p1  ORF type:complete len:313 (+),score=97.58 TRINITY_DN6570_c0_g2_i3:510-1448(+)